MSDDKKFDVQLDKSEPPNPRGGLSSFIGWRRLEDQLRTSGEIRPSEIVTHFAVSENGITYYLKKKE